MPQFVSISSKTTPFWGHRLLTICQKAASCLECFFADKVVGNIHQIYSISFKKVPLKLQGLLKLKHFDSQAMNFGPVLPNSRKRLRNFYHSIGEIKIVLFLRLVLKQHDELKACSKYTAGA